jgi:hypothetical protein
MRAHDRRRLVLAAALTVAAVPAMWMFDGDDADDAATATTVDAASVVPQAEEPPVPVFLDNTTPIVPPAVIDIAVPEGPTAREARGHATFKRYSAEITVERPCTTRLAPPGALLTVTNIDNGLSATCNNTRSVSIPPGADIAIHTNVYVTIAALVDAPVPVRITW